MRKSLLALTTATLIACAPAHAEEVEQQTDREYCRVAEQIAEHVMRGRQLGRPLRESLDLVGDNLRWQQITRDAYGVSRYHIEYLQEAAVRDFADQVLLSCLREE